jgi:hypothetical protein
MRELRLSSRKSTRARSRLRRLTLWEAIKSVPYPRSSPYCTNGFTAPHGSKRMAWSAARRVSLIRDRLRKIENSQRVYILDSRSRASMAPRQPPIPVQADRRHDDETANFPGIGGCAASARPRAVAIAARHGPRFKFHSARESPTRRVVDETSLCEVSQSSRMGDIVEQSETVGRLTRNGSRTWLGPERPTLNNRG